jgi:hypothetical protein
MFKQIIYLIIASVLAVLLMPYLNKIFVYILQADNWVHLGLAKVFTGNAIGTFLTSLLGIFLIPLALALIIAGTVWVFKRTQFVYTMHVAWVSWIVLVTLLVFKAG